jgi:IS30 family transposase
LAICGQLRQAVAAKLKRNWSPEQIAGWLKRTHPANEARRVSHETIYRSLYVQARGVLKQELMAYLRSQRLFRRSRHATKKGGVHGQIVNAVSISERPASVEDRAVPGHWEGDLICGPNNSNIVTLVERHSRYVMLARIPGRDSRTVVNTLIKQVRKLPDELYKSLTWDRGSELAEHQRFTMATHVDVYFCDPRSPWQRGSNENTNRLLRQYFPKGTDLSSFSQAHLNKVARQLNERPRKHWTSNPQLSDLANALRRPVEPTALVGRKPDCGDTAESAKSCRSSCPSEPCGSSPETTTLDQLARRKGCAYSTPLVSTTQAGSTQ